ncbi:MAG TPA: hypothetical protein DDY31_01020 [Lachnospiraceae bacterium]|nr:hypothetical protein [Lachnospiraceae bacterium]
MRDLFFPNLGLVVKGGMDLKKMQAVFAIFMGFVLFLSGCSANLPLKKQGQEQEEPVTITWFVALENYSKTWDPQKSAADAKVFRKTNVNLEIKSGSLKDLDALIATDSLPDLITVEARTLERFLLEDSGMAEPLEPLFEKYAPDVNIPDSMKEWYRNEDGNWYSIASYYYGPERVNPEFGGYQVTHNNNYVRKDLLKQIGMSMGELNTKEGVLAALRAAKKLTYKGQEIIPFSGWWTQNIAEQFGMQTEDENGNYLSKYRQPEWLEALQFGNQMYREGLMLPEEFTESLSQRRKQIQSGRIFFCNGYSSVQDAQDILYSNDRNAQMVYAGHVWGEEMNRPNLKSVPSEGWTATLVSADASHKEEIAKFISYMTQEEATLDAAPTIGTDTYDIVDGCFVLKDSVKLEFQENYEKAAEKYYLNLEFFVDWTIVQKYQPPSERTEAKAPYNKFVIYDSKPVDAAEDVSTDSSIQEIKEKIENVYNSAEIEILTSSSMEECTQKYYKAIARMEKMGLEEWEAYERQQYDKAKIKELSRNN